jgi:hypothetical protein
MSRTSPVWVLSLAALAAPTAAAPCPQDQPLPKKVSVTVVVILASDRCTYVDPRLKCIADEVRKKEEHLTGFSMPSMAWKSVEVNEKVRFPLVEGREVEVVVHACVDKQNRICLAVTPPMQGEIVYRVVCGKFLPIVTRCYTRAKIPPRIVAAAFGMAALPRGGSPEVAALLLAHGLTRDRLILAVRVQPCNGK